MSFSRAITSALSSCTRAPLWSGATTPSCSPTELRPGFTSVYTTRRWRTAGIAVVVVVVVAAAAAAVVAVATAVVAVAAADVAIASLVVAAVASASSS